MPITVKISAIQGETTVYDENTVEGEGASEEKTFLLDISAFSVGRFQLKFEGLNYGKITYITCAIIETKDNFPFTLSSYVISTTSYLEIASCYIQKLHSDCKTVLVKMTIYASQYATVETLNAVDIEETTATGKGEVISINNGSCARYIEWGTTTNYGSECNAGAGGIGEYSCEITELSPGTLYYYRAKTILDLTTYGEDKSFITKPNPPTELSAIVQSDNQIDISWTKGSGAEKTMVRRKVGSYPTSVTDGDEAYFDTSDSFSDNSLIDDTHYYYRAWSYTEGAPNSGYSDEYSSDNERTFIILFVCDNYNNRIHKRRSKDLSYIAEIATPLKPYGIVCDEIYLYFTLYDGDYIQKRLKSDLSFVAKIGTSGSGDDQFNHPVGIACDETYLYVVDQNNYRIQKRLKSDLSFVAKIGTSGSGDDQFSLPRGIACDETYLYVCDYDNSRLQKRLKSDLSFVAKIGTQGSGDDQFNGISGVICDETHIFICDQYNHRIQKRLKSDLSFVAKIGTQGDGDDQFNQPQEISCDETYLYIGDTNNHRIQKRLKSDLSFVAKIGTYGDGDDQFYHPIGISGTIAYY